MNRLLKFIRDKFTQKSQDAILLKACREGNPHAAKVALRSGANPNVLTYRGEYGYSPWDYETQYTGSVSITPILLAATSAKGKDEANYYQVIDLLLENPKTNLDQVVVGHRKEWRSERHHREGFQPDFEEDYQFSLRQVLHQFGMPANQPARHPADLYPMSPNMTSFLTGILLVRAEKEREFKQAFDYVVEGLIARETHGQERRLKAVAENQKVASL